jgi:hypothetical protein
LYTKPLRFDNYCFFTSTMTIASLSCRLIQRLRFDGHCALLQRGPLLRFLAALPSTAAIALDGFASTDAF